MAIAIDPNELDRRIEEAVLEAYDADGYTEVGEDGQKHYSAARLGSRLFQHALGTELEKEQELEAKGASRETLMRVAFPSLPNPDPSADEFEFRVAIGTQKVIAKELARLMQTGRRGLVQKKIAAHEGRGLLLMKAQVGADETTVWFVSANVGLLERYWATPYTDRVKSQAAETAREYAFAMKHNKGAKKMLEAKLDTGMKDATDAAKTVLRLTAGNNGASGS